MTKLKSKTIPVSIVTKDLLFCKVIILVCIIVCCFHINGAASLGSCYTLPRCLFIFRIFFNIILQIVMPLPQSFSFFLYCALINIQIYQLAPTTNAPPPRSTPFDTYLLRHMRLCTVAVSLRVKSLGCSLLVMMGKFILFLSGDGLDNPHTDSVL